MSPARSQDRSANFVEFPAPVSDPAVGALINATERRQADSRLPKLERTRKQKERRRQQERQAGRINLDLPVEIKRHLVALAEKESVPISQLVAFFLIDPICAMEEGQPLIWGYKGPSKCPKYDSVIDIERRLQERKGRH
jgi:hypothetical protein